MDTRRRAVVSGRWRQGAWQGHGTGVLLSQRGQPSVTVHRGHEPLEMAGWVWWTGAASSFALLRSRIALFGLHAGLDINVRDGRVEMFMIVFGD